MKKGLLSLLALALTVVGCQNYDDQFAELTALIEGVQSDVDGLSDLQSDVDALSSTINALASAVAANGTAVAANGAAAAANGAAIAANATAIGGLATSSALSTGLQGLQTQIDAINTALQSVASQSDLDDVLEDLVEVQADLDELLAANATVSQAILINSSASLQYVESVIATGTAPEVPNVIVNNTVTINTGTLTDDEKRRANEVAAKIATVIGNVTITGDEPITMTNLAYVDGDYIVSGADHEEPLLSSVTGALNITQTTGAVDYSDGVLGSIGSLTIAAATVSTATSVDFGGVSLTTLGTALQSNFNNADSINVGPNDVAQINSTSASTIISEHGTGAAAGLNIQAPEATSVTLALNGVTGTLTVNASSTAVVTANSITGTLTTADFDVATANLNDVIELAGTMDAAEANMADLIYLSNGVTLDGLTTVNFPNASALGTVNTGAAESVTLANINTVASLADEATIKSLTLTAQDVALTFSATQAELHTLDVETSTSVNLTVANTSSLTTLSVDGDIATLDLDALDDLTSLTTEGFINVTDIASATQLATINIGHTYSPSYTTPVSFTVSATGATSLDLSSLNKVYNLSLANNNSLASIVAPLNTIPVTPDLAPPITNPSIVVYGNSINATYTAASEFVPSNGVTPSIAYESAQIESPSLSSLKAFILAQTAIVTGTTFDINYDLSNSVAGDYESDAIADCAAQEGPDGLLQNAPGTSTCTDGDPAGSDADTETDLGSIDTDAELAIIQ